MIYIIDTMNLLQATGPGKDKERGFSRLLALFEQSGMNGAADKVFFMIDGYPFPITGRKPGFYFKFSRDEEADALIIRKAKALAPARITVITSDRGIRKALAGLNVSFMESSILKSSKPSGSRKKTSKRSGDEKPQESSDWFNTLYKLRTKDEP